MRNAAAMPMCINSNSRMQGSPNRRTSREQISTSTTANPMVSMYSLAMMKSLRAREKESRIRKRMNQTSRFFPGCKGKSDMKLCTVEIILVISLSFLFLQQLWEFIALGRRHFQELESWFKILIFSLALTSMVFMENLEVLNVVASAAICLAWIEIIFMIGRYPFLGGRFSIMFYAITKKIIQGIVSFIIMVIGFGFAFFVISFGSNS